MNMLFVPEKDRVVLDLAVKIPMPAYIFRLCILPLLFYRRLRYGYTFLRIPLTQGQYAIVDVKDYDKLARYKWCAIRYDRSYYASRKAYERNSRSRYKNIAMHRYIMDVSGNKIVDHINHDGLDNRRANLRIATFQQNTWNRRKQKGTYSSKYKGVTWCKRCSKWEAILRSKGKLKYVDYFDDEKAAARAYNAKAAELFGEFAALNSV